MLRRLIRNFFEVTGFTALVLLLVSGLATWRLSQGPVSLNFFSSHIESALNESLIQARIDIGETNLTWAGWDRSFDIRLVNTKIIGSNNSVIAKVPEMSVSVSLPALLRGNFFPTRVDLIGPSLRIFRNAAGEFFTTVDETTKLSSKRFGGVIAALSAPTQKTGVLRHLEQFSILDAKLDLDDGITGLQWRLPKTNFLILRNEKKIRASLSADLDADEFPSRFMAKMNLIAGAREADINFVIDKIPVNRLAASFPSLEFLQIIPISVSGKIDARISFEGGIRDARFKIYSRGGIVSKDEFWPKDITIADLDVRGKFENDPASIEIKHLALKLDGSEVMLAGSAIAVDEGITIDGRSSINTFNISRLKDFWPRDFKKAPRRWLTKNMLSGQAEDIKTSFSIRIPNLRESGIIVDSFYGKLRLGNTSVRFHNKFPPVRKVKATAVFSKQRLVASIESGEFKELKILSGQVTLLDLNTDKENANIVANLSGPLKSALKMVDNKPLRLLSKYGFKAKSFKGWSQTKVGFSFPLHRSLKLGEVKVEASSQIVNARFPINSSNKILESGNFDLQLDSKGFALSGKATVDDALMKVKWKENFQADINFHRRYEISGRFNQELQEEFFKNVQIAPYVTGPLELELSVVERLTGNKEIVAKATLKETRLTIPAFNWRKAPGEVGMAWVSMVVGRNGEVNVKNFRIQAKGLRGEASFNFNNHGKFVKADIHRFKLGRSDFGGVVKARSRKGFDVSLKGASLDAVQILEHSENNDEPLLPPLNLETNLDRVWLDSTVPVNDVIGTIRYDGEVFRRAKMVGVVANNQPFIFDLHTVSGKQHITLRANDAGGFLAGLDITDTLRGGVLKLMASKNRVKKDRWNGRLTIKNYTIVNAPNLARILTLASFTGILNRLLGKGIEFKRLEAPFSHSLGKTTIKNARAIGAELGLTADGVLNLSKKTAKLRGTMVPAYSINSVLGEIPLIGKIFTGEKGSGVFAATYEFSGNLSKPNIFVNPLAALAPGFLRGLIGILGIRNTDKPTSNKTINPD